MELFSGLAVMNVLMLVNIMCRLPPVHPTGRRPHLHFNLLVCDLCVYPSRSSPSNLLLFLLLLSAHLSADEEDQALISEKTGDLSPQLMDEEGGRGG